MRYLAIVAVLCFLPVCAAAQAPGTAKAVLRNAQGEDIGTATFTPAADGVKISLEVSKLTSGPHAFHIHAIGACEPPDFKSAGGHFNPEHKKHGLNNPDGPHAGDMENVTIAEDGTGKAEVVNSRVTLGAGANSLFQPGGTSIVVHAAADDGVSDPAGNAGARLACGVITRE